MPTHAPTRQCAAGSLALLVALASCATCEPVVTDTVALPAGPEAYYLFSPLGTELHSDETGTSRVTMPPGFGRPTAGAIDLLQGHSAVAFGNRLSFLAMADGAEPAHVTDVQPLSIDALSVKGSLACAVSTAAGRVRTVRIPSGELVWEDSFDEWVGCLHYAVPISENRVLLAGHDGSGVVVKDLDRGAGDWTSRGSNSHPGIHSLQACTTSGDGIILAGLWEEARMTSRVAGGHVNLSHG